jgi:glycosyltransferase involved in cell wall biosynthesis
MIENIGCELIIVNNNCTDDTIQIAEEFWTKSAAAFPLIVVEEKTPGLSFARKAGVNSAKGELIIFCDDDNWLDDQYVKIAYETMTSNNAIGVLAGQSRAVSDIDIPTWFYTYYGNYACGVLDIHSGDVTSRLWVWGAGMVVRKDFMEFLYKKYNHTTKDRTKDSMESGGDVEICYWHVLERKLLWYDDQLKLQHFMQRSRLTKEMAQYQFDAQQKSADKLSSLHKLTSKFYEYNIGKLNIKKLVLNILKLRLREGLRDIYYYSVFILRMRS